MESIVSCARLAVEGGGSHCQLLSNTNQGHTEGCEACQAFSVLRSVSECDHLLLSTLLGRGGEVVITGALSSLLLLTSYFSVPVGSEVDSFLNQLHLK